MILVVTGGRDYTLVTPDKPLEAAEQEARDLIRALDTILAKRDITRLVEGEARGADKGSRAWAEMRGVVVRPVPVDHTQDGPWPAAGVRRNARMWELALGLAAALGPIEDNIGVVAFPGGNGTANMVGLVMASGYGHKIWRPYG